MKCEICGKRAYYNLPDQEKGRFCGAHKMDGMISLQKTMKCAHPTCKRTPIYNHVGETIGRFCSDHMTDDMVSVRGKKCEEDGCYISASFGLPETEVSHCSTHKTAGMINIQSARCAYDGCTTLSCAFNFLGEEGKFCAKHKQDGMVNLHSTRCKHMGCMSLTPNFGIEGGPGLYCGTHRLPGMIDVRHHKCKEDGCIISATFGFPGGKEEYCAAHKIENMVTLRNRSCDHPGCPSTPIFGRKGERSQYCKSHKDAGMIDLAHSPCEYEDCTTRPIFNFPHGKGIRCAKHKLKGMVDVNNRSYCQHPKCTSRPHFGIVKGKALYCFAHKTDDMRDVKHPPCEHDACLTRASYGRPGHPATHCGAHRSPGTICHPTRKCILCKDPALYGINFVPRHCEAHHIEEDQNLVEQECISCHLTYVLDTDGRCEYCHPRTFHTARLAKQNALMAYLDQRDLPGTSTDVVVNHGECGRERPDRVYELADKVIILECDEHQHRDRVCVCEQMRMVNIGQGYGGLPVYFIRWNPDDYSPEKDKKLPETLAKRHTLVGDLIRDMCNSKVALPVTLISAIYLYYDGWDGLANEEWKIIS